MDEFVHYHALGCATAPLAEDLPSFRDGCGLYDLRLPLTGTRLPLRSYYYIGSVAAVPFVPLWLISRRPGECPCAGRAVLRGLRAADGPLLRLGPARVLLAAAVFPFFSLAFLADQGPVGLSALLLLVALLAGRRSLGTAGPSGAAAWATVAGLAVFAGLWVKPVFAWWLPGAALFVAAEARRRDRAIPSPPRHVRPALLAVTLAALVPTLVLFASVDRDGRPYGAAVSRGRLSLILPRWPRASGDSPRTSPTRPSLPPAASRFPPPLSTGCRRSPPPWSLGVGLARRRGRGAEIAGWTVLGAATFVLAATSGFSRWPHHAFFPALFVVFALALALDVVGRRGRVVAGVVVVALWALARPAVARRHDYPATPRPPRTSCWPSFATGVSTATCSRSTPRGARTTSPSCSVTGPRMAVFVKGIPDDARPAAGGRLPRPGARPSSPPDQLPPLGSPPDRDGGRDPGPTRPDLAFRGAGGRWPTPRTASRDARVPPRAPGPPRHPAGPGS